MQSDCTNQIQRLLEIAPDLKSLDLFQQYETLYVDFSQYVCILQGVTNLVLGGGITFPARRSKGPIVTFTALSHLTLLLSSRTRNVCVSILESLSSNVPTILCVKTDENLSQEELEPLSKACLTFHGSKASTLPSFCRLVCATSLRADKIHIARVLLTLTSNASTELNHSFEPGHQSPFVDFLRPLPLESIEEIELIGPNHPNLLSSLRDSFTGVNTLILNNVGEASVRSTIENPWVPYDEAMQCTSSPFPPDLRALVLRNYSAELLPLRFIFKSFAVLCCADLPRPQLVIEGPIPPEFDPNTLLSSGLIDDVDAPANVLSTWDEEEELSEWGSQSDQSYDSEEDEEELKSTGQDTGVRPSHWILSPDAPLLSPDYYHLDTFFSEEDIGPEYDSDYIPSDEEQGANEENMDKVEASSVNSEQPLLITP
ncbi:hypothetical protein DL96DRAFT_1615756 [Flagelloscypha sp. PMI_526]|nr:hypothetical protein DL96DRAFT_1615756 [Flagelloscypha sp. PMI_526]